MRSAARRCHSFGGGTGFPECCRTAFADNTGRDDWQTELGTLLFGTNFGIVTDIQTGPDGNLWLVGTSSGTIRKISRP
jgi:hypothetical protein